MTIAIKICGMLDADNIEAVAALRPDYIGFIFYKESKRYVGKDFLLSSNFPSKIKKVGVFVNESMERIKEIIATYQLDFVQLHGGEAVSDCAKLRQEGVGVIKAFSIDSSFDFNTTMPYESVVDYFLFDSKGKLYGGNGVSFDWSLLRNYHQRVPFFLSGGLDEENLQGVENLTSMNLHGLDFNSGVEIAPGQKDIDKVRAVQLITAKLKK
jgi:phosphoribosylanthranilate isomerase